MSAKKLTRNSPGISIALKYCGSCNPQIDLSAQAGRVRQFVASRGDIELIPSDSTDIDLLILLCGCPRACADKEEIKSQARHIILISGEAVNHEKCHEKDLPHSVNASIEKTLHDLRD